MATSKRVTAKVSPLRGMSVDDYLKKLPKDHATLARQVRAVVKSAAPKSTEAVKWAIPVFESNGPFAFLKPAKGHVTFGFWRGAALADPKGLLEGGEVMRHIKLVPGGTLPLAALKAWVKEAVKLNATLGDPTKKR